MNKVYLLLHIHTFDDGHDDVKLIGIYSAESKAKEIVNRIKDMPGFRDHIDGFTIDEHEVDAEMIGWPEGFITVEPGIE